MEEVPIFIQMDKDMKVIGWETKKMGKGSINIGTEMFLMVIGKMIGVKAKEQWIIIMDQITLEIGWKGNNKEEESLCSQQVTAMMDNGNQGRCMAKEYS